MEYTLLQLIQFVLLGSIIYSYLMLFDRVKLGCSINDTEDSKFKRYFLPISMRILYFTICIGIVMNLYQIFENIF